MPEDLPAIHSIYAHHVLHGLASFEEAPPPVEEMRRRYEDVRARGLPYLAADFGGALVGYGYCAPYRSRSAYRYSLEDSVYVRSGSEGRGVGGALLGVLIERCQALGYRQIIAVIGDSANAASHQPARRAWLRARGHAALGGLQVRALGGQRAHAASLRTGRRYSPFLKQSAQRSRISCN